MPASYIGTAIAREIAAADTDGRNRSDVPDTAFFLLLYYGSISKSRFICIEDCPLKKYISIESMCQRARRLWTES